MNNINIIDRGVIFKGEKDTDQQSCAFPGICVLPGGRWIGSCRAAPAKKSSGGQHGLLSWSDDEGRTWRAPFSPFVPPSINGMPGLFRGAYITAFSENRLIAVLCWVDHSDPSLPYFNEETEGLLGTRIFFAESRDEGVTWSAPELMDTSPLNMPTPITGPVLLLSNGDLACQFELNKDYYDTSEWRHASVLMFSKDGGSSWPEHAIVSRDPDNRIFYWDQRPGVLADGRILDLFWTYDNQAALYRNIHARESLDNGRTWSEMWDIGVPGQPAPPVSLPDGSLVMVYMDRTNTPAVKARISEDNGRTWAGGTETEIYLAGTSSQTWKKGSMQDAWAEMSEFSLGLPTAARLQNGDILVAYYAGTGTDKTDVQWARIRVE